MRRFATTALLLALAAPSFAQTAPRFQYERAITFPEASTNFVRPYQLTVTSDGAVWVLSSTATDADAHNALWRAAPGANTFALVQDYTAEGVAAIRTARGVTSWGTNVVVSAHEGSESSFGSLHLYPEGDRARLRSFSSAGGNGGYGTYLFAVSATPEGMIYATISARPSIRLFDLRDPAAPGFGNWVAMTPFFNEERAGHDGCARSALRDLATIPGADYSTTDPVFFTSRNASPNPLPDGCSASITGRVSIWSGSTQAAPQRYDNAPLISAAGETDVTDFVHAGVAADAAGRLWLTGPDPTRRWVKAFKVEGVLAFPAFDLPSATAADAPDPAGAPFDAPVDVALSADGQRAFVADRNARRVFVFRAALVSADGGAPAAQSLGARLVGPNPFRASTAVRVDLAEAGHVRVTLLDALGRTAAVLLDGSRAAGAHTATLRGADLPAGTYTVRVEALGQQVVRPVVRLR